MSTLGIVAVAAGSLLVLAALWQILVTPSLRRGPTGDPTVTLMCLITRFYAIVLHRIRVEGNEHLPGTSGPLLVVSNHGSPLDPFLIQSACPFFIHWMMARDQMKPGFEDLWRACRVIPTDRLKGDATAAIAALKLLRRNGVVGIFPEGRFERPQGQVLPFHEGIGALVSHSGAAVLLVCVQDTPETDSIGGSFVRPSRSRVRFLDCLSFPKGTDPAVITATLRNRLLKETGWIDITDIAPLPPPVDPFLR